MRLHNRQGNAIVQNNPITREIMHENDESARFHSYGGPEVLRIEDVPIPSVRADEVLIRVHAAGVNPLDWKVRAGYSRLPFDWAMREGYAPLRTPDTLPAIPGFDVAGVVEAVGAAVKNFAVGDEVFAVPKMGGYAAYVAVAAYDVAHKPRMLSFVEAAAMPVSSVVAWQVLFEVMHLQPGQRLLIHGAAGGVGASAVQLAKWRGGHVTGTASENKLSYLRYLGVDEAFDYTTRRFETVMCDVDAVLALIGGETQQRSLAVLKPGSVLVTIAIHSRVQRLCNSCLIYLSGTCLGRLAGRWMSLPA